MIALLLTLLRLVLAPAWATDDPPGAVLQGLRADGTTAELPLLRADVTARVDGDLATVSLVQTFANDSDTPINARYLFPLPEQAAVHRMRLTAGGVVVEGVIRRKAEAQAEFDQAKSEGKQAALLTQHRPNVFTQDVANLPPGESVKVEITYAHAVPRQDGAYHFVYPMAVGPRYVSGEAPAAGAAPALNSWTLGSTPPAEASPAHIDAERVGLRITLDAGLPLRAVSSPSHALAVASDGATVRTVTLAEGRVIDNRDFVLTWTVAGDDVAVGVSANAHDGRGVVSLLVEPPAGAPDARITPRELVFVLDTSCSMNGAPLDASKRFMKQALESMRATDTFRVLRFSSSAEALSETAQAATPANVKAALSFVDSMESSGGTEMLKGVQAALGAPKEPGVMRIVVFLTDGYIGDEASIVAGIESMRADARLFSLGIGRSVNRYLLQEMARAGRGEARIVLDAELAERAADQLAERLAAPFLTDVTIDWGGAPVREVTPKVLPDLFLGSSMRVMARFDRPGTFPVTVHGRVNGEPAALRLQVTLPATSDAGEALPILWARSQVEDRMVDYLSPTRTQERPRLEEEVTTLGLEYGLVTQWTSFVAVARELQLSEGAVDVDATSSPTASPAVAAASPQPFNGGGFSGSAAPEPAFWLAALLLAALSWLLLERRPAAARSRR